MKSSAVLKGVKKEGLIVWSAVIFCRQMMFALPKSSVCELWFSKQLFAALLLLLVIFMAIISFLMPVSCYYSLFRSTTVEKLFCFPLSFSPSILLMWLDGSTAVFAGRSSFTKRLLFEGQFPFLTADSSVPEELIIYSHPLILDYCFNYLFIFWVLSLLWSVIN